MSHRRTLARLLAGGTVAGAAVLGLAGPAAAHVTITPSETAAGAYTVLTFSNGHGCDGSPTTALTISIPEGINAVTPTRHPFYRVEVRTEALASPITDAHGNQITERDAVVVYTARKPLPDGQRDAVEVSLQLPDTPGETLAFPVIQTCEQGETAWTEVAASGQSADELEHPAPTVTITEAAGEAHGAAGASDPADTAGTAGAADTAGAASPAAASETGSAAGADPVTGSEGDTLGAVGLGAGVLGLLAGGAALVQVRRRA